MGYYDSLHDTNCSYCHLFHAYKFNEQIYFNWRKFLEITHLEDWEGCQVNFESFDDYISFCILDWAFHIQDEDIGAKSIELAAEMLNVDTKLLHFCRLQTDHDGIVSIWKSQLEVRSVDFLKKSIEHFTNRFLQA